MIELQLKDELPFVTVQATYLGKEIEIPSILVDTGSASTMLAADIVAQIGIVPEMTDTLHTIRGAGGTEVVFTRHIDRVQVGRQGIDRFEIEIGGWITSLKSMGCWEWIS